MVAPHQLLSKKERHCTQFCGHCDLSTWSHHTSYCPKRRDDHTVCTESCVHCDLSTWLPHQLLYKMQDIRNLYTVLCTLRPFQVVTPQLLSNMRDTMLPVVDSLMCITTFPRGRTSNYFQKEGHPMGTPHLHSFPFSLT
jgi:hypothetical protein